MASNSHAPGERAGLNWQRLGLRLAGPVASRSGVLARLQSGVPGAGTPAVGPGVTGTLSTIKRSDGATQAVYSGHPLYTYVGDSAPGQAHGNNLNLNGGLWHEVTVSG